MITVVNEPQAEYGVACWQTEYQGCTYDDFICGIENETIMVWIPIGSKLMSFSEKPKRKLSALRGKLSKQSKKEIDDQISYLRSEWDRSI
jgi:hypothetical protein